MRKKIEIIEFVQGVDFGIYDALRSKKTNYSLTVGELCGEICNSKAFVDKATAGRHRGKDNMNKKHSLFPVRDQVATLSSIYTEHKYYFCQILRWCDAKQYAKRSVGTQIRGNWMVFRVNLCSKSHFLIDLAPRTDDRARYCSNSGTISWKFYATERVSIYCLRTMNNQTLSTLQVFHLFSLNFTTRFLQFFP